MCPTGVNNADPTRAVQSIARAEDRNGSSVGSNRGVACNPRNVARGNVAPTWLLLRRPVSLRCSFIRLGDRQAESAGVESAGGSSMDSGEPAT